MSKQDQPTQHPTSPGLGVVDKFPAPRPATKKKGKRQ